MQHFYDIWVMHGMDEYMYTTDDSHAMPLEEDWEQLKASVMPGTLAHDKVVILETLFPANP